jgi:hypothetical protein
MLVTLPKIVDEKNVANTSNKMLTKNGATLLKMLTTLKKC